MTPAIREAQAAYLEALRVQLEAAQELARVMRQQYEEALKKAQ